MMKRMHAWIKRSNENQNEDSESEDNDEVENIDESDDDDDESDSDMYEDKDLACVIEEDLKDQELKNELDILNDVLSSLKSSSEMQWKVMNQWKQCLFMEMVIVFSVP